MQLPHEALPKALQQSDSPAPPIPLAPVPLVAERADRPGAWQAPQGGLQQWEEPLEGAGRELAEETGIRWSDVTVIAESPQWLGYELPPEARSEKTGHGRRGSGSWFGTAGRTTASTRHRSVDGIPPVDLDADAGARGASLGGQATDLTRCPGVVGAARAGDGVTGSGQVEVRGGPPPRGARTAGPIALLRTPWRGDGARGRGKRRPFGEGGGGAAPCR
ncbi:MAG: NUDIX domain-containing protein [Actinomycetota bacterium]